MTVPTLIDTYNQPDFTLLIKASEAIGSLLKRGNLAMNSVNYTQYPMHRDFREDDVRHSQADFGRIQSALGYELRFDIVQGIAKTMP